MIRVTPSHMVASGHTGGDVAISTDAAMATAHLIALEEHLAASVAMLDDAALLAEILNTRALRKTMLETMIATGDPLLETYKAFRATGRLPAAAQ